MSCEKLVFITFFFSFSDLFIAETKSICARVSPDFIDVALIIKHIGVCR